VEWNLKRSSEKVIHILYTSALSSKYPNGMLNKVIAPSKGEIKKHHQGKRRINKASDDAC